MRPVDNAFRRQLDGYSLATAEITYHLPDAQRLLQPDNLPSMYLQADYSTSAWKTIPVQVRSPN